MERERLILPRLDFWRNGQWFGKSIPANKPVGFLESFPLKSQQEYRFGDKFYIKGEKKTYKHIHLGVLP